MRVNKAIVLFFYIILLAACLKKIKRQELEGKKFSLSALEKIEFVNDEIFYLEENQKQFGYLSLKDGTKTLQIDLQTQTQKKEKVIEVGKQIISLTDSKNFIKTYNIQKKYLLVESPADLEGLGRLINVANSNMGQYVLLDKQLRKYHKNQLLEKKTQDLKFEDALRFKQYQLVYNHKQVPQGSAAKFLQVYSTPDGYPILVTQITKKDQKKALCLIKFDIENKYKVLLQKCFEQNQNSQPKFVFSLQKIYINVNGENLILDQNLNVQTRFKQKVVGIVDGVILLEKGLTLYTSKDAIYQELYVICDQQIGSFKLKIASEKIELINKEEDVIAQLEKHQDQNPYKAWLTMNLNGDYTMLVQWANFDVSLLEVASNKVSEKWSIKFNKND